MFKRILLSLGVIAVVGGAAIAGTQALLSDDVTLTANTFSTGSVDLQIWNGSAYVDGPIVGFTDSGMLPGESSGPHVVWLNNNSSAALSISATAIVSTETLSTDDVIVTVTPMSDDGTASTGPGVTQSLTAWETPTSVGTPNIPAGQDQRYHVTVEIDDDVEDSGLMSVFDFTFTGEQVL